MGTRRNYQRTSNKNDSPLHVLPVAEKLIDYTLDLTDNAKRFFNPILRGPVTPNTATVTT